MNRSSPEVVCRFPFLNIDIESLKGLSRRGRGSSSSGDEGVNRAEVAKHVQNWHLLRTMCPQYKLIRLKIPPVKVLQPC